MGGRAVLTGVFVSLFVVLVANGCCFELFVVERCRFGAYIGLTVNAWPGLSIMIRCTSIWRQID
jgi:hypothetical protein